jgi:hypothetical protein
MARPDDDGPDLEGCTENHCHARKRDGSGTACHLPAGWATDHATNDDGPGVGRCKLHGGATRNARAAGRAAKARIAVERFGGSLDVDPATALLEEVQRSAATVAYLQLRVQELEDNQIVWGVVEETDRPITDSGGGLEVKRKAQPNAWITLYQQERRHLRDACKAALDAGATKTLVDVYKQTAGLYVQVLGRVLDKVILGLDLSDDLRSRALELVQPAFEEELNGIGGEAA